MSPNGDRRGQYFRNGAFDEVYLIYSPLVTTTGFLSVSQDQQVTPTTLYAPRYSGNA